MSENQANPEQVHDEPICQHPEDLPAADFQTTAPPEAASPAEGFEADEMALLSLQQELRKLGIPVVIVLEGWAAAGKGTMAGELLEGLDPRGYQVYVPEAFEKAEEGYPALHSYLVRMPAKGQISLFIGSWYHSLCVQSVKNKHSRRELAQKLELINQMEHSFVCDGVLFLKFFINISRKEQKRRLREMEDKKTTRMLVSKADWAQNEAYDQYQAQFNLMLAATGESGTAWQVLRGENKRDCKRQLYDAVLSAFQRAIDERKTGLCPWDTPTLLGHEPLPTVPIAPLYAFDPVQVLDEDYKQALNTAQKKLHKLQFELYKHHIPMAIAFEGWDAAGKGGAIRRLSCALDPRGFTVVPISAPTPEEKAHHHLWRFWKTIPASGNIAIFDRSWYGRVMVERIEGFCTEPQWQRAYEEINLFEHGLAASGMIVRKFWLQIDADEQLKRFTDRQNDPQRAWKLTDEDWRNREKWPAYEQAVNEMLQKTNTSFAPWIVVEANNKQYARLKVLNAVIEAIEEQLRKK
ncbi:MAG: phosphate--AMP phosphotransferase [Clostridia bacterium]